MFCFFVHILIFFLQIKKNDNAGSSSSTENSPHHCEVDPSDVTTKHFRHLYEVLSEGYKEGIKQRAGLPPGQAEMEKNLNC